jgi:HSP20 family protein
MNPDDINVTVNGNQLVISGEKRDDNEERRGGFHRSERRYGMFRRVVELPYEISPDDVDVEFDNGLLKLRVPQSSSQAPHRIPIKGGSGQKLSTQSPVQSTASASSAREETGSRYQTRGDGSSSPSQSQGRSGSSQQRT